MAWVLGAPTRKKKPSQTRVECGSVPPGHVPPRSPPPSADRTRSPRSPDRSRGAVSAAPQRVAELENLRPAMTLTFGHRAAAAALKLPSWPADESGLARSLVRRGVHRRDLAHYSPAPPPAIEPSDSARLRSSSRTWSHLRLLAAQPLSSASPPAELTPICSLRPALGGDTDCSRENGPAAKAPNRAHGCPAECLRGVSDAPLLPDRLHGTCHIASPSNA